MRHFLSIGFLSVSSLLIACAAPATATDDAAQDEGHLTSTDGQPLEFRFDTEVVADKDTPAKNAVIAQLEYLQGVLTTGSKANAQFRFVKVESSEESAEGDDKKRIKYTGSVAVIYPAGERVPTTYDLALPLDVTKLSAFNDKYDGRCGKNEYGRETFWHDFNPRATGCTLDTDVTKTKATVRPHPLGTTDKYPEYDKIWADGRLDIVAVYGAISNTSDSDSGARDLEALASKVKNAVDDGAREEVTTDGVVKHSVVTGTIGGKPVRLVAYFVSEASSASDAFFTSYREETKKADIVLYSGHSGLGQNIAALAKATETEKNHYQIAFFNGCQSFGYLGPWMHETRRDLNGADVDPNGTKFLDVIVTTLPAYSETIPTEQILFDAVLEKKKGWQELLRLFSGQQWNKHLTSVFGEDDNTFTP